MSAPTSLCTCPTQPNHCHDLLLCARSYQQHGKPEVQDILKEYRIGQLVGGPGKAAYAAPTGDPWTQEPPRHPALIARCAAREVHTQHRGWSNAGRGSGIMSGGPWW